MSDHSCQSRAGVDRPPVLLREDDVVVFPEVRRRGNGHQALGPDERDFLDAYYAAAGEIPDYPAIQAAATASLAAHCGRQTGSTDRELLWPAATALHTSTLYGAFTIDHTTGAQVSHQTVLTRWIEAELVAFSVTQGFVGQDIANRVI